MANICNIENCGNKYLAKGYCSKHYNRVKRGLNPSSKTRFDRRPAEIKGDIALISLANGKGIVTVDAEHSNLSKRNWSLSGDGYAVSWIDGKLVKLHHLIIGKPTKGVVDHINRDKLDNRLNNLRITSQKVNVRNTGLFSTNTSGHKGVVYDKRTQKWIAQAFFDGRLRFGGRHKNINDAVNARKQLENQYAS